MITVKRFTATWCAPCKMLAPVLQGLAAAYPAATFEVIDINENPEIAQINNIRSVPTVIIEKDGVVVEKFVGVQPKQAYIAAIEGAFT